MIATNSWSDFWIWDHSETVKELYAQRCRKEVEEMTCSAQAVELLRGRLSPGDSVLDIGCGSGYLYHSFIERGIDVEYWGIDASDTLLELGRKILPEHGLPPERLVTCRIEDLSASVDHVVCMNVLSNIDNFHRPLERILRAARKSVVIRESVSQEAVYRYVTDEYLDEGVDLKVYVNSYAEEEFSHFIESYGFRVSPHMDIRTGGKTELIIGYPHHWKFFVGIREAA